MPFKNQHPLYSVWAGMRSRCSNPNNHQWRDYGGRGITVCGRWNDFHAFVADMGPRPHGFTLDRIDNEKEYSPENCRWADRKTQQRNRRVAVHVVIEGVEYRAIELAERANLKTDTIVARAAAGLSLKEVLSPQRRVVADWRPAVAANKRKARMRTHCSQGHAFTNENTRIDKNGCKHCRTCHNEKMREFYANKKQRA